jgi:hypothetical protein
MNDDLKRDPKEVCYDICAQIYIARNITLNHDMIIKQLERIDYLLATREDPFYDEEE